MLLEAGAIARGDIERRELGKIALDVAHPLGDGIDLGLRTRAGLILGIGHQQRAHAARQVDDDINAARAHTIDYFIEQPRIV